MDLIKQIFDSGVVGCGGAGFPTHVKLKASPEILIINGAECEPLLRTDRYLMIHEAEKLVSGVDLICRELSIPEGRIALKKTYTKEIEGYRIVQGTQAIEIPIKRGEETGEPQTIARGIISFKKGYQTSTDLKIEANFDQTGLLAIKAYLLSKSGVQIETGSVEFAIGAPLEKSRGGGRIIPVSGAELIPANEIDVLKNLFSNKNKNKSKDKQKLIESRMETILNCGNPEDFEEVILKHLSENNELGFRNQLYKIAAELAHSWSEEGLKRLREVAQKDIISVDFGFQVDERKRKLSEYVKEVLEQI